MRSLAVTLVLCGLGLLVSASVGAAPPPPPKYWSAARCERAMLARPLTPPAQVVCVGSGGAPDCRWTSAHRARLYSEFAVFTRYDHINNRGAAHQHGNVWSFTLATRSRPGFTPVISHWGDQYQGWPADFFMAHLRVLAPLYTSPARFRSIVAPIAARLRQQENASGCTGVS